VDELDSQVKARQFREAEARRINRTLDNEYLESHDDRIVNLFPRIVETPLQIRRQREINANLQILQELDQKLIEK